jgi:hypothetical protein
MGDSFTGGYRVGQAETFSNLIQQYLTDEFSSTNVEVLVSVIEDPLTGLYWLNNTGLKYEPDLVILGITLGNDLSQVLANYHHRFRIRDDGDEIRVDIIEEGGELENWKASLRELTIPKECLSVRSDGGELMGPQWSQVPGYDDQSKINLRLWARVNQLVWSIDHDAPQTVISDSENYTKPRLLESNGLGMLLIDRPPSIDLAFSQLFDVLEAYSHVLAERNVDLLVAIFPQRYQVQPADWEETLSIYGLVPSCFDAYQPTKLILDHCESTQLPCLDSTPNLKQHHMATKKSLYLPFHDMHWNPRGHAAQAEALKNSVAEIVRRRIGKVSN